jgi:tRNA-U20-dihydrouridine synthase
LVVP